METPAGLKKTHMQMIAIVNKYEKYLSLLKTKIEINFKWSEGHTKTIFSIDSAGN